MTAGDRVIRWSTAGAVVGVAAVAAVVPTSTRVLWCGRAGASGWTARLIPLTVDGLIYASSMAMLDLARRGVRVPALPRWLLDLGIAANVTTAWGTVRSWPQWACGLRLRWSAHMSC